YGYRLTEHFRDTDLLVCTDEYLNRKVAEARANADKTIQSTQRRLRGNFDLIEFDYPKAADILNSLRPKRKKRNVKLTVNDYRQTLRNHLDRLRDRSYWFVCDDYGRVHSTITSLKKTFLGCLSVGGKPIVWLDIRNSQPLVACLVAMRYHLGS